MTIREYISDKLQAFNPTEAEFVGFSIANKIALEEDITNANFTLVERGMVGMLESVILAPYRSNVSESGFSMSWDFSHIGKWYQMLCKKYGLTPNEEVLDAMGISRIIDRTNIW